MPDPKSNSKPEPKPKLETELNRILTLTLAIEYESFSEGTAMVVDKEEFPSAADYEAQGFKSKPITMKV